MCVTLGELQVGKGGPLGWCVLLARQALLQGCLPATGSPTERGLRQCTSTMPAAGLLSLGLQDALSAGCLRVVLWFQLLAVCTHVLGRVVQDTQTCRM